MKEYDMDEMMMLLGLDKSFDEIIEELDRINEKVETMCKQLEGMSMHEVMTVISVLLEMVCASTNNDVVEIAKAMYETIKLKNGRED